ncbi:hypothetical protein CLIB1423_04S04258 [[Candida] railenensis]|uniref:Zn(2)-C6 fungal-type domain-containing protein n=1 Tax=[Candida] railenensis TaxID=45579 RepID=A0A9P0VX71_9ASCO|nr:hypothetical protein CLIB1423_04S04258 [[Candida] railenensis]
MQDSAHSPHAPGIESPQARSPDAAQFGSEGLSEGDRRAKSACIRCRNRKTKCSGDIPCKRCKNGNFKCEYMRKRKRVSLYDTEIEDYVLKIQALEKEVQDLKQSLGGENGKGASGISNTSNNNNNNNNNSNNNNDNGSVNYSSSRKYPAKDSAGNTIDSKGSVDLSVYLGSGSSELVCWNLKRFTMNQKNQVKSSEVFFSPEFNSFIEESVYDYLLTDTSIPSLYAVETLTIDKVESLLANVVLFINSGYLTLDPMSFKKKLPQYFDSNGVFKIDKLKRGSSGGSPIRTPSTVASIHSPSPSVTADSDYFFLIKIIMICTLGEIYSPECSLGSRLQHGDISINEPTPNNVNFTLSTTPGLQFFKIVIHFLPSIFSTLNLSRKNLESNLDIIELLGLISIYLRCIDKKNLAVMFTINALQLCVSMNLHKKSNNTTETRIFWSIFCLNRFFCSRIGKSLLLREDEITTPLPTFDSRVDNNQTKSPSSDEFSKSNLMVHYIYLAKIAEQITNEIYCFKPSVVDKNKEYLNSILTIVHDLVDWVSQLPEFLRLRLPLESGNPSNRLIYTLHLNSLHHIYLSCIPILLNLTKSRIANNKDNSSTAFDLEQLPKNIRTIIRICIQSSQLTINLFIALYKENLTRIFGFTDLDYLFSSSLVFIICLILKLPNIEENYTYEEYLQVAINLIGEMKNRGNLVARGKLNQILDLTQNLKNGTDGQHEFGSLYQYIKGYYYNQNNQPTIVNLINETEAVRQYEHIQSPAALSITHSNSLPTTQLHPNNIFSTYPSNSPHSPAANTPKDNTNQLLNDFELGKDFTDYSSLTEPLFNDFPLVTEEDMMFMNNIIQDFQSMSDYVNS